MRRLLLILFILTTSLTSFQSLYSKDKNKQIRMSLSGIVQTVYGDIEWKKTTFDDELDDRGPVSIYTVDWTCLDVDYFIFKGKVKNVTIHIYCGENGTKMFTKKNVSINGKYKLDSKSINWNQCIFGESSVSLIVSITDKNDNEIYRCEITGSDCPEP